MDISTSTTSTTVATGRVVEHVDAGHGLFAVRWTDTVDTTVARKGKAHTTSSTSSWDRILTKAQLREVEKGLMPATRPHHVLLAPGAVEALRTHSYQAFCHVLEHGVVDEDEVPFCDPPTHHQRMALEQARTVAQKPFTTLVSGAAIGCVVGENRWSDHVVVDVDGRSLAVLQVGEYIFGLFDNAHYDLIKAADHLLARPDVRVCKPTGYGNRTPTFAKTAQEAIHQIPGYNAERGRDAYLTFRWMPTQADWDRVCAGLPAQKGLSSSDTWRSVFEQDILGLRACGAAHFDDFYEALEPEGSDDD